MRKIVYIAVLCWGSCFFAFSGCREKKETDVMEESRHTDVELSQPSNAPSNKKQPPKGHMQNSEPRYSSDEPQDEKSEGPDVHVAVEEPHASVNVHSVGGKKEVKVSVQGPLPPLPPMPGFVLEVEVGRARTVHRKRAEPVVPAARASRPQPEIPPGHYPPPGKCRIWYPDRPSGHQPPPGDCDELRRRVPPGAWLIEG